ncbi:MAG: response regulator [Planctomycetales bacterium]|nr:response regulator [Planctomycetales bacterium]
MNPTKKSASLLVVDDDPCMVRLLVMVISRAFGEDIAVEGFTDVRLAVERIEEGSVDILLTDLEMPEVDGLELLRIAKRRNAYTQVLLLTGRSSHEALLAALEAGATDYALKPFDQQQLLELVSQAHERRKRWQRALVDTWQQQKQMLAARQ